MPVIPTFERLRQEDGKFKISLNYTDNTVLEAQRTVGRRVVWKVSHLPNKASETAQLVEMALVVSR